MSRPILSTFFIRRGLYHFTCSYQNSGQRSGMLWYMMSVINCWQLDSSIMCMYQVLRLLVDWIAEVFLHNNEKCFNIQHWTLSGFITNDIVQKRAWNKCNDITSGNTRFWDNLQCCRFQVEWQVSCMGGALVCKVKSLSPFTQWKYHICSETLQGRNYNF